MANKNVAELKGPRDVALLDDEIERDLKTARAIDQLPREAFAIPFLKLLQQLSPETKKMMTGYVEGAQPGMLYNTVSGKLYTGNIVVVAAHMELVWIEWVPKDKGGGLVEVYPPGHPRILEAKRQPDGKQLFSNGNVLEETHQHYVVVAEADGTLEGVLINMKGTQRKESKRWNTQVRTAMVEHKGQLHPAKPWHYAYVLGVEEAANERGSWFKWAVKGRVRSTREQLTAGRDFAKAVVGGERRADLNDLAVHDEEVGTPAQQARTFEGSEIGDLDDNDLPMQA